MRKSDLLDLWRKGKPPTQEENIHEKDFSRAPIFLRYGNKTLLDKLGDLEFTVDRKVLLRELEKLLIFINSK